MEGWFGFVSLVLSLALVFLLLKRRGAFVVLFLLPLNLYAQGAGTPPYRGTNNWPLIFGTDNTYDIGAVGATRPRTGYFGTSVITPALTVSGLTATRVPFAGSGGLISDDADMTFDGTSLSVDRVLTDAGADATPNLARAADTDDGIVLGEVSYFVRDSTPTAGFSASGNARNITFCSAASCGAGLVLQTNSTFTSIANSALALTAGTMTSGTLTAGGTMSDGTSSFSWTNAQVVALGATTVGDITVATLPAKAQVLDALVVITGAAAGPATVTVSCGDAIAGTPFINYTVASDAKAAANTVYGDAVAERGTSIDTEWFYLPSYTATTLVTCHFISTGANLSTVTGSTGRVILTTRLLP